MAPLAARNCAKPAARWRYAERESDQPCRPRPERPTHSNVKATPSPACQPRGARWRRRGLRQRQSEGCPRRHEIQREPEAGRREQGRAEQPQAGRPLTLGSHPNASWRSMSEIDHVFARMGGCQSTPTEQRELRSIPRRGGATGSRVVEVVRLPPRGATAGHAQAHRPASKVLAATWDGGFPPKSAWAPSPSAEPIATVTAKPVAHMMPMWEPAETAGANASPKPSAPEGRPSQTAEPAAPLSPKKPRTRSRRVADPFDPADEGANCLRCGYAIQPARARRGLMTCAGCG